MLFDMEETLNSFIWQRSEEDIYPAKEIIFICYYNRNKTETVLMKMLEVRRRYLYAAIIPHPISLTTANPKELFGNSFSI
jgi:hypothetical protein